MNIGFRSSIIGEMKTFLPYLFVVTLLLSSPSLFSRGPGTRGLLIGFNASTFSGSDASIENSSLIPGLTLGFFHEFELNPRLFVGPEITFTTRGSCLQSVGDLSLHQVITYLELPVPFNWTLNPGDRTRVFLSGGPAMAFMMLAFNEVGFPEEIARFDLGVSLGTGMAWRKVQFRVHMNQGLLDLDKSNSQTKVKNRSFSFTTAFSF